MQEEAHDAPQGAAAPSGVTVLEKTVSYKVKAPAVTWLWINSSQPGSAVSA